jgi:hypothetical protein
MAKSSPAPADLYAELRLSHDRQRELCSTLVAKRTQPGSRRDALSALRLELESHAAAEERYLYVPMMMLDAGLSISRHALAEHHEIEELTAEVGKHAPSSDAFLTAAHALVKEVRHHLKEEEKAFFQLSGRLLTDRHKTQLASRYRREKARMERVLAPS